ncbi:MAG: prolipoprotein diacylglyceryl transferase [Planctomycetes bacterium]|nr:prolipoprotein diacylglyceryl transferase [Planctomycetota bacterium]
MIAAMTTGAVLSRRSQRSLALSGREKLGICLGAFCGAMIGAKLPFVISDPQGLLSGAAWFADGKTILCGLVGGYFGVEIAKWSLHLRIRTGDSFAVPVAASIAVGRLACFSAGCCHGTPTSLPWAVVFPVVDQLPRHPTQLYESAFHLTAALVLYQLGRRGLFHGQLIKLYIIAYAMYRFVSETIRPEARLWGNLTIYQWAALLLIPLFAWLWARDGAEPRDRAARQPAT